MTGTLGGDNLPSWSSKERDDVDLYNTPEKWYVRQKWVESAIQRKIENNRHFLRYLTLTSIPVYDIRLFEDQGLIRSTDIGYDEECIAVCEVDLHRASLIRNNLPGARVFPGRIQELVGSRSVNYHGFVNKWFPFDVINLDLTGSIFARNQLLSETIQKIFTIQSWKEQSFTLFLTVCSVEEGDDVEAREKINALIESNLTDDGFKDAFIRKFPNMQFDSFQSFLSVAIPKLIIEKGLNNGFDVACNGKYTYIGTGLKNQIASFILDCDLRSEPGAITNLGSSRSLRIIDALEEECVDINQSFSQNTKLKHECDKLVIDYSKPHRFGGL
jgi:hypothetical protein